MSRGPLPFHPAELIDVTIAAALANVDVSTIRRHALRYHFGRKIGGRFRISRPAFAMHLAGDHEALWAYSNGDRSSRAVVNYFRATGCAAGLESGVTKAKKQEKQER